MLSTTEIQSVIGTHNLTDELYVELPTGEVLELCGVTVKDGKLVLKTEIPL